MKNEDIVLQLASVLPSLVDNFTTNFDISSISHTGTTVTVETSIDHGLSPGRGIYIAGVDTPIGVSSLTRDNNGLLYVETSTDHDLTKDSQETVTLIGADPVGFNGDFKLEGVANRRNFTLSGGPTSGPLTPSTLPNALDINNYLSSYNGLFGISSTPAPNQLTFEVGFSPILQPVNTSGKVKGSPRITSVVTVERLIESYTRQAPTDYWLFSVLEDTIASKDQNTPSDATSNIPRQNYMRQATIQQFHLYLVVPCSDQVGAAKARDIAEDMFRPICQSILFKKMDSGLYVGKQFPVMFNSHGPEGYNTAFYIHRYTFDQLADLYLEDTVGRDDDVAFRDISLGMATTIGTESLLADIDLDEEPLP